jgi:hypothetical protein
MQAFAALQAERRWVATGTPIVNSPGQFSQITKNVKLMSRRSWFLTHLLEDLQTPRSSQLT